MKVIRILVYEGTEEWMRSSLGSQRKVSGSFGSQGGEIKEFYLQEPIHLPTASPFEIKSIDDSILELIASTESFLSLINTYEAESLKTINKEFKGITRLERALKVALKATSQ